MQTILLGGVLGGITFFALLTVSDALFYSRNVVPPVLRTIRNGKARFFLLGVFALVDGLVLSVAYRLFWEGPGWFLKGLTLGLLCGLVLMRPQWEAWFFFRKDLLPRIYVVYWGVEYFVGYTILGVAVAFFQEYLKGATL